MMTKTLRKLTTTAKVVKPLKWHGGKHYLAKRIIELMPPHLHYVEPYFGGGSVLLARDPQRDWFANNGERLPAHLRGCSEVVNDINRELTNFWRVLAHPTAFDQFAKLVNSTPFSEHSFRQAIDKQAKQLQLRDGRIPGGVERAKRAVWFFVRYRQSRQGLGKDFATLTRNRTRGNVNEQANAYWGVVDGLPAASERLREVVILDSQNALKVIKQQDGENTLFYLDPPYLHQTRVTTDDYEHEMTATQHSNLLKALGRINGSFILSGYRSAMYDGQAKLFGWRREDIEIDNKASSKSTKDKTVECLWMNY